MKNKIFLLIICGLFLISFTTASCFGYNNLDNCEANVTGGSTNNYYNITGGNETTWIANYSSDTLFRNLNLTGNITSTNGLHIFMPDNLEEAFTLQQGSNHYIHAITLNGQEELHLGHDATGRDIMSLKYNGGLFQTKISGDLNVTSTMNGTALLFINGSTGRIGIGNSAPTTTLDVTGTILASGDVKATGFLRAGNVIYINPASNLFRMNDIFIGDPSNPIVYSAQSFEFETTANVSIFFSTNNTERMRIVGDGNIGIRTATPDTALKVNGSINVTGDVNYGGSLNSYSPLRFGKDKEKGYTTFCVWDKNGNQTLLYWDSGVLKTEINSKYCKDYVTKDEQRRVIEKLPQIPSANDIVNKTIIDIGVLE